MRCRHDRAKVRTRLVMADGTEVKVDFTLKPSQLERARSDSAKSKRAAKRGGPIDLHNND